MSLWDVRVQASGSKLASVYVCVGGGQVGLCVCACAWVDRSLLHKAPSLRDSSLIHRHGRFIYFGKFAAEENQRSHSVNGRSVRITGRSIVMKR